MEKSRVMLHPVRMRVIQQLLLGEPLTILQLLDRLGDVPQATLYRHMKVLQEENIVEVVATNKVYNREERVYSVVMEQLNISDDEIKRLSKEDHLYYFTVYHSNLLQQVSTYLNKAAPEHYREDGFGYGETPLHLTNEQFQEFVTKLNELLEHYAGIEASEGSTPRTFSSIFIPQPPFRTNEKEGKRK